jgi:hypothetical protein
MEDPRSLLAQSHNVEPFLRALRHPEQNPHVEAIGHPDERLNRSHAVNLGPPRRLQHHRAAPDILTTIDFLAGGVQCPDQLFRQFATAW